MPVAMNEDLREAARADSGSFRRRQLKISSQVWVTLVLCGLAVAQVGSPSRGVPSSRVQKLSSTLHNN
jgi:hypothetical protein